MGTFSVFDNIERTELRPKRERESIYRYYNSSARPLINSVREIIELWFGSFPVAEQANLRSRLRSPIDSQHSSAFWELYLFELFTGLGYSLEAHPQIGDLENHPDFLVKKDGVSLFYLEAVVAGIPSMEEVGHSARLAEVLDLVNGMETPEYFLEVRHKGFARTPPPFRKLRVGLETWIQSLKLDEIDRLCKAEDFERRPEFSWSHDGLTLLFRPIPKSSSLRGSVAGRSIGMTMGEFQWMATDDDIRRVLEVKAKKYGRLQLPLIIGVNVQREHCDDIDVVNALFGNETILVNQTLGGRLVSSEGKRKPDGLWYGNTGPRNQSVSAVFVGKGVNPYSCGTETPVLFHNPYLPKALDIPTYPLPQRVADSRSQTMKLIDGKAAPKFIRVPKPWPPTIE